jgi:hypothetical protein
MLAIAITSNKINNFFYVILQKASDFVSLLGCIQTTYTWAHGCAAETWGKCCLACTDSSTDTVAKCSSPWLQLYAAWAGAHGNIHIYRGNETQQELG